MRVITVLLFLCVTEVTCAQSTPQNYAVNWPSNYEPDKSKFFVHNEIEIAASPEKVWAILVEAVKWPDWYKGAQEVVIANSDLSFLQKNSVFTWKTMGLNFKSTVKEFDPASRLSWESKKKSIQGYHAWVIIPTATGCRVITDESQNGWLTFFEKTFQGKKLKRLHDVWLTELKKKSEQL
jgi:uncharacterized protein YndB with AHSA1/START domain